MQSLRRLRKATAYSKRFGSKMSENGKLSERPLSTGTGKSLMSSNKERQGQASKAADAAYIQTQGKMPLKAVMSAQSVKSI
jgi:hypothetical protein